MASGSDFEDYGGLTVSWGRFPANHRHHALAIYCATILSGKARAWELLRGVDIHAGDQQIRVFAIYASGIRYILWRIGASGVAIKNVSFTEQAPTDPFMLGTSGGIDIASVEMESLLILEPVQSI